MLWYGGTGSERDTDAEGADMAVRDFSHLLDKWTCSGCLSLDVVGTDELIPSGTRNKVRCNDCGEVTYGVPALVMGGPKKITVEEYEAARSRPNPKAERGASY